MRITDEQIGILNKFSCSRLSDITDIDSIFQQFKSEKGSQLVEYLKRNGLTEDAKGHTAYYVVFAPSGKPCFFFSIQCGALFDAPFDEKGRQQKLDTFTNSNISVSINPKKIKFFTSIMKKLKLYHNDLKKESGRTNIYRVNKTYSSTELVHFCKNDDARDEWNSLGINHTMGEVVFWWFVAPIIIQIQKHVGCQFVHLFAADNTVDEDLIKYYQYSLHFKRDTTIGTTKPYYDYSCVFLCQTIKEIRDNRELFLSKFNIDEKEDYV